MIGALSVAGLLATVLALASSPATAQQVVTITTDDIPGIYTVSWETSGGCDPSKPDADTTISTDGATGSISRTVGRPAGTDKNAAVSTHFHSTTDLDTDDNENPADIDRGRTVQFSIAIGTHCQYDWKASFTSGLPGDEGTRCSPALGARDSKLDTDDDYDADPVVRGNHPQRSIRIDDTPDDPTDDMYSYYAANEFTFDIPRDECGKPGLIKVTIGPVQCEGSRTTAAITRQRSVGGVEHTHEHGVDSALDEPHTHTHNQVTHRHYHGDYYLVENGIYVDLNGDPVVAPDVVANRVLDPDRPSTAHDDLPNHYHQHPGETETVVVTPSETVDICDNRAYDDDNDYFTGLDPTIGAILNTTFTVTATPVKDSDDECQAVTKETEVNDKDTLTRVDDKVVVNLPVLVETLELTKRCEYDVVADLPDGFDHAAGDSKSNEEKVSTKDFNDYYFDTPPTACNLDPVPKGTDCVRYDPPVTLNVAVAVRAIYILQRVTGPPEDTDNNEVDSYGNGRYELSPNKACNIPTGLDVADLLRNTSGGIHTIPGITVVELREGHFNITGAILNPVDPDPDPTFDPAARYALNADADPCVMEAKVFDMPDGDGEPHSCTADTSPIAANMVTGVDRRGRAILSFDINCSDAIDDDAMDDNGDEAMDDNGDEAMPTGDEAMPTGDEDAGEEMVDADPMGNMEDDGDAMGPPPDEPTG